MPSSGPKVELRRLTSFVREAEARYLAPHIGLPTLRPPSRAELLDIAAFVVLIHGAIENFAEGLTIWIATRVEAGWLKKRRVTRSTASVLFSAKCTVDYGEMTSSVFDTIRNALSAAQAERSDAARDNNGIAPAHLRRLLVPLGVDIPSDPILIGSLNTLVAMRHEWAHQYRFGAKNLKSAQDVKKTADDCLALAGKLSAAASALRL